MRHADLPGGWADKDHARAPAELLDQLRQRLERLPDGHPSAGHPADRGREAAAARRPPARERPPEAAAGGGQQEAGRAEPAGGGQRDLAAPGEPGDGDDLARPQDPAGGGEHSDRQQLAGERPGRPHAGDRWPDASLAGGWQAAARWHDIGGQDGGTEPYRPWFMADDHADPWFDAPSSAAPWFAAEPYPDGPAGGG